MRILHGLVLALLSAAPVAMAAAGWGLPSSSSLRATPGSLLGLRGGEEDTNNNNDYYVGQLEAVQSNVVRAASAATEPLAQAIESETLPSDFGQQADALVNRALSDFAAQAPPPPEGQAAQAAAYDRALQAVEAAVDAPLHVLYLKLLALFRERALQQFRLASSSDYAALLQAESQFVRDAESATREGSDWDFSAEKSFLQTVLSWSAEQRQAAQDVKLTAAQQQQTAMSFLQSQQQMIQQLQMQLYGQTSPWNVGVAYRLPDSNFNLQGSYQQGRANVQLSCVPDEYAPLLGPNGFTQGVGPGNLGLSLNLSL